MSEYIYGSSLRAAKSKVNYLFEGDFRRKPSQNLSGASRSLARGELLQQAAEQRLNREGFRRKEHAVIKVQSVWRSYRCRKARATQMRHNFDEKLKDENAKQFMQNQNILESTVAEFLVYFHSVIDKDRIDKLIDAIIGNKEHFKTVVRNRREVWMPKFIRLMKINNDALEANCSSISSRNLCFLEFVTKPNNCLDAADLQLIWLSLIRSGFYGSTRRILDNSDSDENLNQLSRVLLEIVRRSLDLQIGDASRVTDVILGSFFCDFLRGPLSYNMDNQYSQLLRVNPNCLRAKYVLSAFQTPDYNSIKIYGLESSWNRTNTTQSKQTLMRDICKIIWMCYLLVRTIHQQLKEMDDLNKSSYLKVLSMFIEPAEYVTNISLMQVVSQDEDDEDTEDDDDDLTLMHTKRIHEHHSDINQVISKIVDLLNETTHIDPLKSIIFKAPSQDANVQLAIIKICNLMLSHEPIAIFHCRLLYTVAFSREFLRSLWTKIVSISSQSLFGRSVPIYTLISRGNNISESSWASILPHFNLFCSMYSYLLPTFDENEFTSSNTYTTDNANTSAIDLKGNQDTPSNFLFAKKELVNICAILRDVCVGMIDILYQDNRHIASYYHNHQSNNNNSSLNSQDEQSKLQTFRIKICFKSLVKLVRQLHIRDSRKQFCPDGHWICPSVVIPANKAIDFQLVTSQKGRLLSQMTKDNDTFGEIKTVLILQEIPFVVSFYDRVQIFHQLLSKERQIHQTEGYHFGLAGSAIQVQIRRNYIYEDAFEKLSTENEPNIKLPLRVSLVNTVGADEAGIDGGGLSKEFLSELLKAGFDPMRGFFKSTKDHLLYPNPSANVLFSSLHEGYETHYEFLGRMLGKAIFEKIIVELPLADFFLAKLLARKHSSDVDLHNLASLDPVLYKNLVYLKNYQNDVLDLNLDFTIANNELGEHEVVELKPGGRKIAVNRDNKIEYVHLVADYRLNKQIRAQCAAFKRGLTQLIDLDWLRMFDPRELQILISGTPTAIDVDDWRRHTVYTLGYTDDCAAIQIFWKVVSDFNEDQRRKLLKFATSCSLPPLLGFKDLVPQFAIAPTDESRLPSASTCMNILKLPKCEDEDVMKSKILYAIDSNVGFELS